MTTLLDGDRPRALPATGAFAIRALDACNGRGLALFALLGVWFFVVFPTEPLYFENQNTKYLHGMALAGIGQLDQDWTATTEDVMPVFTALVYLLHAWLPPWSSYLVQMALFAVFLHGVIALATHGVESARVCSVGLIVGLICVASQFSNGGARVWGGVAKQYLLGPALEPQSFGVLFLTAAVFFLRQRHEPALVVAALPAIFHPGYVVPAGVLMAAMLFAIRLEHPKGRRPRLPVALACLAAAGASMLYLGLKIMPSDAQTFERANDILARVRIPRHAIPAYWFDIDAFLKLIGAGLTLLLVRARRELFWLIAFCLAVAVGSTLLAALFDSSELGMISPWRISVYLVPICLALLIGEAVRAALAAQERASIRQRRAGQALGICLAVFTCAATVQGVVQKLDRFLDERLPAHARFMRDHGAPGQLYVTDPDDMNIRLQSGMPQLVSWKSHPYQDVEVLEWYDRFQLASAIFSGRTIACDRLADATSRYRVTHLLISDPAITMTCPDALRVFSAGGARIFALIADDAS